MSSASEPVLYGPGQCCVCGGVATRVVHAQWTEADFDEWEVCVECLPFTTISVWSHVLRDQEVPDVWVEELLPY